MNWSVAGDVVRTVAVVVAIIGGVIAFLQFRRANRTPTLSFGTPAVASELGKGGVYTADPLPDGRQLVLIRGEGETDEVQRLAVVLNFSREQTAKLAAR